MYPKRVKYGKHNDWNWSYDQRPAEFEWKKIEIEQNKVWYPEGSFSTSDIMDLRHSLVMDEILWRKLIEV